MRGPGEILLVSTYELGHAPQGIAVPWHSSSAPAFTRPRSTWPWRDSSPSGPKRPAWSSFPNLPDHTALRLAIEAARRIRSIRPQAVIAFHGLYATLNADLLATFGAQAILGAECEQDIVHLAEALCAGQPIPPRLVPHAVPALLPHLPRLHHPVPSRGALPGPERYTRFVGSDGEEPLAGYAETTRGCKHLCRHCPIPAVLRGPLRRGSGRGSARRHRESGPRRYPTRDVRRPRLSKWPDSRAAGGEGTEERFDGLTFDFTAKVEHIVGAEQVIRELACLGAAFVTSAVESFSDEVLSRLAKGHRHEDAMRAFAICEEAGIALRPTFVPFTPWETLDGYLHLLDRLGEKRMAVPGGPGSALA